VHGGGREGAVFVVDLGFQLLVPQFDDFFFGLLQFQLVQVLQSSLFLFVFSLLAQKQVSLPPEEQVYAG
jgi:hypothetical protein